MSDVKRHWLAWSKPRPDLEEKAYPPGMKCSEWRTDAFVLAEDYDALKAEAQALREEVAALRARVVVVPDEREAFESAYIAELNYARGTDYPASDMKGMREGDSYGSGNHYLNGQWKGWQARARLNGKAVSEGLLRRIDECMCDILGDDDPLRIELRTLLHPNHST